LPSRIKTQQRLYRKSQGQVNDQKVKEDQRKARLAELGEAYRKTGEHAHSIDMAADAIRYSAAKNYGRTIAGRSGRNCAGLYTAAIPAKAKACRRNATDAQSVDLTNAFKDVKAAYNYSKEVERAYGPGGKNVSDDVAGRVQSLQDVLSKILSTEGIIVKSIANG
jgi:transcription initiation factor TFIIIB Brf1 subunit/transcription initiation factor TFIIB